MVRILYSVLTSLAFPVRKVTLYLKYFFSWEFGYKAKIQCEEKGSRQGHLALEDHQTERMKIYGIEVSVICSRFCLKDRDVKFSEVSTS